MEKKSRLKSVITKGGILSRDALRERLQRGDLIVSPLLDPQQVGDGAIDISLGNRLLTGRPAETTQISPEQFDAVAIRRLQRKTTVPYGAEFTLHPHSFHLGCTFEFIALPRDLCAFVISRSSYGRLGLIIATASYVHPCWKGCLTLELENIGDMPLKLKPLSLIGQLVIAHTTEVTEPELFGSIPVIPEYRPMAPNDRWERIGALRPR